MYRYICIDFGSLSVIVSSTGRLLFFCSRPGRWTWLELVLIPNGRERESRHLSLSLSSHFLPPFSVSSSPPQRVICSPVASPPPPKPHVVARPPRVFFCFYFIRLSDPTLKVRDWSHRCSRSHCTLDLLDHTDGSKKLFTELGPFPTCSMEKKNKQKNVM